MAPTMMKQRSGTMFSTTSSLGLAIVTVATMTGHVQSIQNDFEWQVAKKYQKDSTQLAWKVKESSMVGDVARMVSSDYCVSINSYCANYKCCGGLVCEPVYWDGQLQPLCVVPDASQFKGDACYGDEHICYFHYQCCSGTCVDDDGDKVFTCETNPDHPYADDGLEAGVLTTTESTTTTKQRVLYVPPPPNDDLHLEVHFGKVDSHVPFAAIGVLVAAVAFVVIFGFVAAVKFNNRRDEHADVVMRNSADSSNDCSMVGSNRYNGWLFDGDETSDSSATEVVTVGGYQIVPGSDVVVEGPPVPDRDYSPDGDGIIGFENGRIIPGTPPRPQVDYVVDSCYSYGTPSRPSVDYN